MGVCTTRHWQSPGRLVQELNVCTVQWNDFNQFMSLTPANMMIKENLPAKCSLDKQNVHKSGTLLKMTFVTMDCQLVETCLYDSVCCNC